MRIWWQSAVDPAQNEPYLTCLREYLNEIADPGTVVDVQGMAPGDRHFGRLTELRCAVLAVDNALEADAQGYDAFVLGHFQDGGLYEARSALTIPVVGLGETSLHWAAQLGRNIGLVTSDPVFERWHLEQADLYGLSGRVTQVVGLGVVVEDFVAAFDGDEQAVARMLDRLRDVIQPMVDAGADVIVPAGALPALVLRRERALTVGHAPVVNAVAVTLKAAEAWVRVHGLTGLEPSRGPSFGSAPGAVDDFRDLLGNGRKDTQRRR
jgi:Asp/Glu/hydantoin racemase